MRVANKPRGMSPTRPPNWREERRQRLAREQEEHAQRQEEREQEKEQRRRSAPGSVKPSAITTRATLAKQRGGIERASAWLVLLISFLGSIVALHGGWPPFIASLTDGPLNLGALLGGILIQLVLTFLEWWYFDRWAIAWGARLIDAFTTALGYGPLFLAPLTLWLFSRGIASPDLAAWGIIGVLSLLVAWYPENRLID